MVGAATEVEAMGAHRAGSPGTARETVSASVPRTVQITEDEAWSEALDAHRQHWRGRWRRKNQRETLERDAAMLAHAAVWRMGSWDPELIRRMVARACDELGAGDPEELVRVVSRMGRTFRDNGRAAGIRSGAARRERLRERRAAVAALDARGLSIRGIATELGISRQSAHRDLIAIQGESESGADRSSPVHCPANVTESERDS